MALVLLDAAGGGAKEGVVDEGVAAAFFAAASNKDLAPEVGFLVGWLSATSSLTEAFLLFLPRAVDGVETGASTSVTLSTVACRLARAPASVLELSSSALRFFFPPLDLEGVGTA